MTDGEQKIQQLFRAREVAERLGISLSFAKKLMRERRIQSIRIGTAVRVPLSEIERIEREGCGARGAA